MSDVKKYQLEKVQNIDVNAIEDLKSKDNFLINQLLNNEISVFNSNIKKITDNSMMIKRISRFIENNSDVNLTVFFLKDFFKYMNFLDTETIYEEKINEESIYFKTIKIMQELDDVMRDFECNENFVPDNFWTKKNVDAILFPTDFADLSDIKRNVKNLHVLGDKFFNLEF